MSPSSYADSRKDAVALLALINVLPQAAWERRMTALFLKDDVQGPIACAWMLQQIRRICSAAEQPWWQAQINACTLAARIAHKLHHGMSCWDVVHHKPARQLARYNTEPVLGTPRDHRDGPCSTKISGL